MNNAINNAASLAELKAAIASEIAAGRKEDIKFDDLPVFADDAPDHDGEGNTVWSFDATHLLVDVDSGACNEMRIVER